ncbi:MAG: glycosyltransferase [Verrucomicrobiota bacterium]
MKVLFVSNLFPNRFEPARGVFNLHQMRHLAQLCEVRVLAPYDWFFIKGRFAPPEPLPATETIAGLTVHHSRNFYLPKIGRTLNPWFYGLSALGPIRRIREQFPFDIIYVNWAYPDACGIADVARKLRVPFVVSISGSDANWYLKMRIRRRQILRMLAQAKAITVRSQALRQLLIDHQVPAEKITVLYNGVDVTPAPRAPRQDKPILLYVGRLSSEKGVADLLRAIPLLKTPVRLHVVGDGAQRDELRHLAAGLDVVWLGWKKPAEVPTEMARADLLCLPSHMEGVPNAALEAFACGLPVVATRVGGIPEIVTEQTGLLAEPQNPTSFADALTRALRTKWDSAAIRRHATQFDWNVNAERLHKILQAAA